MPLGLAEMAEAAAIAIGRGDRRGAERAAVIAALEGEHQALAVLGVAHELERILDRLGAADIEVHPTLGAELALGILRDQRRELDLLAMEILAGDLRQRVDLALQRGVEARIGVAEIHRRIPHLQVEEAVSSRVQHEGTFAAREDLGHLRVVHRVAMRAVLGLERQQARFIGCEGVHVDRQAGGHGVGVLQGGVSH
jgi:hypothetical protein